MKDKYRQPLVDLMLVAFPAPDKLDAFLKEFRPGAWFIGPGKSYPEKVAAIVDDALQPYNGWVVRLLEQLAERFPKDETVKQLRLAAERDIVDVVPFPAHLPLAQELERVLASLYTNVDKLTGLTGKFEIYAYDLPDNSTPLGRWRAALTLAAQKGVTRALVEEALRQNAASAMAAKTLRAVLEDIAVPISPTVAPEGESGFITGSDDVQEEALLHFDDLTISVGDVEGLIQAIGAVMAFRAAVCRITVEVATGYRYFGTGFRVGGDFVLTNHHVLVPLGQQATNVVVNFNDELSADGSATAVVSLRAKAESIVAEKADDWGVIEVPGMDPAWPVVDLTKATVPVLGQPAFILQHPGAAPKRLGFVRNRVGFFNDQVVHYLTDTQPGSSGAPVFDGAGRVIALHHVGGKPQQVVGKPPVSMNEGIRISRVLERMKALNLKVGP